MNNDYFVICNKDTYTAIAGRGNTLLTRTFASLHEATAWARQKTMTPDTECPETVRVIWAECPDGLPYGSEAV